MLDPTLERAYEELYDAARFLKRCNVRAFSAGEGRLTVELGGGDTVAWRHLWDCMDHVSQLRGQSAALDKPKRVRL